VRRWLVAALAGAAIVASGCARPGRPNILLVVADTARADRIAAAGYARPTTPTIDALARDGAIYLEARTPSPWTLPAHASLFTGLYPSSHGAEAGSLKLDDALPFLARRLHDAGYRTEASIGNPWVGKDYNFQQGFDRFEEVWRKVRGTEADMGAGLTNDWLTRWIDERASNPAARDRPFFLFVNYFEPHLPYNAPEPERLRFVRQGADPAVVDRARRFKYPDEVRFIMGLLPLSTEELAILGDLYDGEIAYVDRRVGELVEALRRNHLLDSTVVVVTSDHGEMLGEHRLLDHKLGLYEPVLRIPLVVRYPPAVRAGQRITTPVMLQDLYPTLLALAGAPPRAPDRSKSATPPEARPLPGISGLDPVAPRGADLGDPILAEYARPTDFLEVMRRLAPGFDTSIFDRTVVEWQVGGRKLIWSSDGAHHLYDVRADPGEMDDLGPASRDELTATAARVEAWLHRSSAKPPLRLP
jgi:arylsulfatase A-like enzyme